MNEHTENCFTYADRDIIKQIVPEGVHVLDLGCGDGSLLADLVQTKNVIGRGVDIDSEELLKAMERGLSVYHRDLDKGLADFPDNSYEYVILNQTLQVINQPVLVLREMMRIATYGIVGVPNFGHWLIRALLLYTGRMPKTQTLPFEWYNTPNIHQLTIRDFKEFCAQEEIEIIREDYFMFGKWRCSPLITPLSNMFAQSGMFLITQRSGG